MASRITVGQRVFLTLLPLMVLLTVRGTAEVCLMYQLGGRIDAVLQDNYQSIAAMEELKEAADRIDSSLQVMLLTKGLSDPDERTAAESKAHADFTDQWQRYEQALEKKQSHVTVHPEEDGLVNRLKDLTNQYRNQGRDFDQRAVSGVVRNEDYEAQAGPRETIAGIKQLADEILQLNQREMKRASAAAKHAADSSLIWLGLGFASAIALVVFTVQRAMRQPDDCEPCVISIPAAKGASKADALKLTLNS